MSKRKISTVRRTVAVRRIDTLDKLLQHFNITNWDLLIIGDGSGCGWSIGAGWASVLVERHSRARKLFYGAMNAGTVTLGELFPFIQPLIWYTGKEGPGKKRLEQARARNKKLVTYVISDSLAIVRAGNMPSGRHAYSEVWAILGAFEQSGFDIHFRHVERDLINLHVMTDAVSRAARKQLAKAEASAIKTLQEQHPGLPEDVTPYDFNP